MNKDRVRETSTTTGTSDFTLAGAVTGFATCNAAHGTQVGFLYCIEAVDGSGVPTGQWETGWGYLSGSTTLVRAKVDDGSSGAGVAVNFSAGSKIVFTTYTAKRAVGCGRLYATVANLVLP